MMTAINETSLLTTLFGHMTNIKKDLMATLNLSTRSMTIKKKSIEPWEEQSLTTLGKATIAAYSRMVRLAQANPTQ